MITRRVLLLLGVQTGFFPPGSVCVCCNWMVPHNPLLLPDFVMTWRFLYVFPHFGAVLKQVRPISFWIAQIWRPRLHCELSGCICAALIDWQCALCLIWFFFLNKSLILRGSWHSLEVGGPIFGKPKNILGQLVLSRIISCWGVRPQACSSEPVLLLGGTHSNWPPGDFTVWRNLESQGCRGIGRDLPDKMQEAQLTFFSKIFFFWCGPFFKVFIGFVTILLLFDVLEF